MKQSLIVVIVFVCKLANGFAQGNKPTIIKDNMLWLGYYSTINLNPKWSVNSDLQLRTRNEIKNYSQVLIRTDVSRRLSEKITATIGLAHFRFFITNTRTRGEWRPWQEFKLQDELGKVKVTHRLRIEERYNEVVENNTNTGKYLFNFRFRYKLDIRFRLNKEKENAKNLVGIIGNEIMVNAGKVIRYNYFDQNRTYAGLNLELNKSISFQIQYMHFWQQLSNGYQLNSTNVLRFNIYHTISL